MNNRIYKFRAWDKVKNEWIPFDTISFTKENTLESVLWDWKEEGAEQWVDYPNFILSQYTGLTDKHGKEIYEGDIVEYDKGFQNKPFYNLFKLEIGFSRGSFLLLDPEDKGSYRGGFSAFYLHTPCLTVIGNVFEHPNLLQVNSKKDE